MKKDAYYFPHFSNARNDSKIIKLRRVLGLEGYAIYFMLLEVLREQTDFKYPVSGIEDLSFEWHVSKEKIQSVIGQFDLFQIDEKSFFSSKLVLYLQPYLEKSARASLAANKRWENIKNQLNDSNKPDTKVDANADAKALQMQCYGNASKVKNSKVKNSKVKELQEDYFSNFDFSNSGKFSEKFKNKYLEFFEMRKKIKKPIKTENAIKGQLESLYKYPEQTAIQMLQNSINGEYQGIFPLKNTPQQPNTQPYFLTAEKNEQLKKDENINRFKFRQ